MTLILQEPCSCKGTGCDDCDGSGQRLTEDGRAVRNLINLALNARDNARADAEYRRDRLRAQRAIHEAGAINDLRRSLELERWAREDLERKVRKI